MPQYDVSHYRELKVWQIAHELALTVSQVVVSFPPHERYELASQLKRAALSVPSNIVEGQARYGGREALRFARIAAGSLAEVDYLLFFAKEKGYVEGDTYLQLEARRAHASRLLNRLIQALRKPSRSSS